MTALAFPEVARQTRRAWLHAAATLLIGGTIVFFALLSEEEGLFESGWLDFAAGATCYGIALALKVLVEPRIHAENAPDAAVPGAPAVPDRSVQLLSAPWLPLPLRLASRLPTLARWLSPQLSDAPGAIILSCRVGSRVLPKRDILTLRPHVEGIELVLASGARLDLRTARIPRSVLGTVFAPLAAALLSARYDALQFNQALARRLAGQAGHGPARARC